MKIAKKLLRNSLTADEIVGKLLVLSETEQVCLLDSCGVSHLGSRFLIGGVRPLEYLEFSSRNPLEVLQLLDKKICQGFAVFTISYDFGLKINNITQSCQKPSIFQEPDVFLALFDCLIVHDYQLHETFLFGNEDRLTEIENLLLKIKPSEKFNTFVSEQKTIVHSNFTRAEYLEKIEEIKELIRSGETYQTNLTQQFTAELSKNLTPQQIFYNLRQKHPAPFASFIKRQNSYVVSASPERFFKVCNSQISTSPIKGTRPRGRTSEEDSFFRQDLLKSVKDRAENIMIVDLLRNDLGRICRFGSIEVEKICDLEQHPTLFHLVSTIKGDLRDPVRFSEIIKAVFPCGSITGAPKISTMKIIDRIEKTRRGLPMGAIGLSTVVAKKESLWRNRKLVTAEGFFQNELDLAVAIRTMVIKENQVIFNVGGGIVIDSLPESEYQESLTKAKALLRAINGKFFTD